VTGATLYFVPLFFGVQAMEQEFLAGLTEFLVSSMNQALAWPILLAGLAGYGLTGLYIFGRFVRGLRTPAERQAPQDQLAPQSR